MASLDSCYAVVCWETDLKLDFIWIFWVSFYLGRENGCLDGEKSGGIEQAEGK